MTAERLGFDVYPVDYYARMWREFQPDDSRMLIAEYEGEPVAATMIVAANRRKINRWLSDQPKLDHRGRGPLKESKSRLRDATYGAERPKPWVNTRPLAPDRPPPGPPDPDDWVGDPAA